MLKHAQSNYQPSLLSYEPGHLNMTGLTILEAAILAKQQQGLNAIEDHNTRLTRYLLDRIAGLPLQGIGPLSTQNRCSIYFLKDRNGLGAWLKENKIITTLRNDTIRISIHYYNTQDEVDALIDCLTRFPSQPWSKHVCPPDTA
jgi:selenocysteine lyase/cysteine desulfurase